MNTFHEHLWQLYLKFSRTGDNWKNCISTQTEQKLHIHSNWGIYPYNSVWLSNIKE
jgi:hypothetical protein